MNDCATLRPVEPFVCPPACHGFELKPENKKYYDLYEETKQYFEKRKDALFQVNSQLHEGPKKERVEERINKLVNKSLKNLNQLKSLACFTIKYEELEKRVSILKNEFDKKAQDHFFESTNFDATSTFIIETLQDVENTIVESFKNFVN